MGSPDAYISSISTGVVNITGNAVVGGTAAVANTSFNNLAYGEQTSLGAAGGLGVLFGAAGTVFGALGNRLLSSIRPDVPNIPVSGVAGPIPAQGRLDLVPSRAGNAISNTVGAIPAFIEIDNGLKEPK